MNRVICVKGHFYDGDKYDTCPHCAAGVAAITQSAFAVKYSEGVEESKSEKGNGKKEEGKPKKEKKSLFGRKNIPSAKQEAAQTGNGETLLLQSVENSQPVASQSAVSQLVVSQPIASQPAVSQPFIGQPVAAQPAPYQPVTGANPFAMSQSVGSQPAAGQSHAAQSAQKQSLGAAFAAAAGKSEERDEGKTVGYFSTGANMNPPVGYLICIAGEDFGMGFPLKSGSNSMGRSASMDVVVMDEKVSREKQAFVIYEPLKREFYLKPGEGSALCYLNGNVVLEIIKLKQHDVIMLGSTKLMLIQVCGDAFSWDEIRN